MGMRVRSALARGHSKCSILAATFTLALLSSCYNYKIFPKEFRNYSYTGPRPKAYVLNPQLKKEYKILKSANIFELVSNNAGLTTLKISLRPLKKRFTCGEPVLGSLITLGQVPVLLLDRYEFSFEEIAGNDSTVHDVEMDIAEQVWFWNMFVFNKKFDQKAGQILLARYYTN
jgi:hypothetical protein